MLYLFVFYAIPDTKPVPTFAGIALAQDAPRELILHQRVAGFGEACLL